MSLPLVLLLAAAVPQSDEAARLFERTHFDAPVPAEDEGRRVLETLTNPKAWLGAYASITEKLGSFPSGLSVSVDFKSDGPELARAAIVGNQGRVSFNLNRLVEGQKHLDEVIRKKKEVEGRGGRVLFKIPPVKFDRIIYHELTHLLQRNYEAPTWFLEGMAQLIGDDPNSIYAFRVSGRKLQEIDAPVVDRNDTYARGHLFWKWLDSRGMARRVAQLTLFQNRPWQEALEVALQSDWSVIRTLERDWSAKELEKLN